MCALMPNNFYILNFDLWPLDRPPFWIKWKACGPGYQAWTAGSGGKSTQIWYGKYQYHNIKTLGYKLLHVLLWGGIGMCMYAFAFLPLCLSVSLPVIFHRPGHFPHQSFHNQSTPPLTNPPISSSHHPYINHLCCQPSVSFPPAMMLPPQTFVCFSV